MRGWEQGCRPTGHPGGTSSFYNLQLMFLGSRNPRSQKGWLEGVPGPRHPRTRVTLKPGDIQGKGDQWWMKGWEAKHILSEQSENQILRGQSIVSYHLESCVLGPWLLGSCCLWVLPCLPTSNWPGLEFTTTPEHPPLRGCPQAAPPCFPHFLTPQGKVEEKKFRGSYD